MSVDVTGRVLVGVDDLTGTAPAVEAALSEARRAGCGLSLVHAFASSPAFGPSQWLNALAAALPEAHDLLEQQADRLRAAHDGLDVDTQVVVGRPAPVLIEASRTARLTVVGCRGVGGFTELLLGSVSAQVAAHAHSPVLVIRPPGHEQPVSDAPVLVGIDGAPGCAEVVQAAFEHAHARGVELVAAHCWASMEAPGGDACGEYDRSAPEEAAQLLLDGALTAARQRYPQVRVVRRLIRTGATGSALVRESAEAGLVVVGSRGHAGAAGVLLNSVSQALLHHARCPVVVIR
ncbi:universal stress protein [Catellatospora chokoriensis]|uniref:Universal stress protein n=1 Tax=Catellatospora chokoriensis TaxID=310353 RepID=A0A8J3KF87_9ACTN|nr:universal stress protein [Catellatospora chokoriensis]GIF93984.1 universal stress protein [Catellatospora chokoriensis]